MYNVMKYYVTTYNLTQYYVIKYNVIRYYINNMPLYTLTI